jgi:hypothetical protein
LDDPDIRLDPAWFLGVPGLTFSAGLKYVERNLRGVKLEAMTDLDMFSFVLSAKRGGICQVNKRYTKANNKYMGADFDASKPSNYILYLDANNLYGWAMSQSLPTGKYKWIGEKKLSEIQDTTGMKEFLKNFSDDSASGCFVPSEAPVPAN